MIRRFGEAVVSGQKYTRRPGVYAVIARGEDLLVTHQAEPIPEFQLPGGGIDPGESHLTALHREVFEETGWRIRPRRKLGVFRRFTYMPEYDLWAEKLCHIYLAQPVREISAPTELGHTALWMPADVATVRLGNSGDRHFVRKFMGWAR